MEAKSNEPQWKQCNFVDNQSGREGSLYEEFECSEGQSTCT